MKRYFNDSWHEIQQMSKFSPMKRNKLLQMLLTVLGFGTCSELESCAFEYGPPPEDYTLRVTPSEVRVGSKGGTEELKVVTDDSWSVSHVPSYCTATPTSGRDSGIVHVYIDENYSIDARYGYILIIGAAGGESVMVDVIQNGSQ